MGIICQNKKAKIDNSEGYTVFDVLLLLKYHFVVSIEG